MVSTDWTAGYVAGVNYTVGYYPELNPLRLRLALLNHGIKPPEIRTACELGFGQGLSVAAHAAASEVEWWGTDFNPGQAAFARSLDSAAGSGSHLFDLAFDEFARIPELPDFDLIALHGIWSWISDENRAVIVDLIRRKLRPGGVVYISYNTFPGWASFVPMRQALMEHVTASGETRALTERIGDALKFAERLLAVNPTYARANPLVAERIKTMKGQDRRYLAHEFFNQNWDPMPFNRAAELLASAKLSYACSAYPLDHVPALNLSHEQQGLLAEIKDPIFHELVRDMIVNQQFRRDYWIKGPQSMSGLEQAEALRAESFVLSMPRSKVSLKVKGALGEGALSENIYVPILDALSDGRPKTLGEIAHAVEAGGVNLAQVVEAAIVLSASSSLTATQPAATVKAVRGRTDRLNAFLQSRARSHSDVSFLASPLTGGAIGLSRFDQIFLASAAAGRREPKAWAEEGWSLIAAQGQKIVKEGQTLQTADQNLAELKEQAELFGHETLPLLFSLGMAPVVMEPRRR